MSSISTLPPPSLITLSHIISIYRFDVDLREFREWKYLALTSRHGQVLLDNCYYYLFLYSEAGKGHSHHLPQLPLGAVAGHHHRSQLRIVEGDGRGGRAVQEMKRHARATGARTSTITSEPRGMAGSGGSGLWRV